MLADWFYIEPTHSLRFAHAGDALALVVFVAVSALVSGLVDRLARRSAQLARSQAETEALGGAGLGHRAARQRGAASARDRAARRRSTSTRSRCSRRHPTAGGSTRRPANRCRRRPEDASYSAELVERLDAGRRGPVAPRRGPAAARRRSSPSCGSRRPRCACRPRPRRAAASPRRTTCATRCSPRCRTTCAARSPTSRRPRPASLSDDVEWPPDEVRVVLQDHRRRGRPAPLRSSSNLLDMGRLQAGMLGVHIDAGRRRRGRLRRAGEPVRRRLRRSTSTFPRRPAAGRRPTRRCSSGRSPTSSSTRSTGRPKERAVRVEAAVVGGRIDIRDRRPRRRDPPRPARRGVPAVPAPRRRRPRDLRRHRPRLAVTKGFVEAMDGEIVHRGHARWRRHRRDHAGGRAVSRVLVVDDDLRILQDARGQPARPRVRGRPRRAPARRRSNSRRATIPTS